jgi:hypothetical protein
MASVDEGEDGYKPAETDDVIGLLRPEPVRVPAFLLDNASRVTAQDIVAATAAEPRAPADPGEHSQNAADQRLLALEEFRATWEPRLTAFFDVHLNQKF